MKKHLLLIVLIMALVVALGAAPAYAAETVSVSSPHGDYSASPSSANENDTVTISGTPDTGYEVTSVTAKLGNKNINVSGSGNGPFTFTVPKIGPQETGKGINVTVSFRAVYSITTSSAAHGSISVNKSTAAEGEQITITATPESGYQVKEGSVKYNDSTASGSGNSYSFTMPDANVTVTAEFEAITYEISVDNNIQNGSISIKDNKTTATVGEKITVTATPNEGYKATSVTFNSSEATGSGKTFSFTMPAANVTVSATFKALHKVTKAASIANGSIEINKTQAAEGETVTVTPKPKNINYKVDSVTTDPATTVTANGEKYTFTMPDADVTVSATFVAKTEHTITVTVNGDTTSTLGTATPSTKKAVEGQEITVTVTKIKSGYEVSGVDAGSGVTVSGGGPYTFTMPDADVDVNVTIEKKVERTIKVTSADTTMGTASANKEKAKSGETITITAKPKTGYKVDEVKVLAPDYLKITDAGSNKYTFTMPVDDVEVMVYFEAAYKITVKTPKNGKVTTDPAGEAGEDDTVTIKPVADSGYTVTDVTVKDSKGKAVTTTEKSDGTYTFTMPASNVTVDVTFTDTSIKVVDPQHGKVTVTPKTAKPGEEVTIKAEPDKRYVIDKVTVKDGNNKAVATKQNKDGTYTFKMPEVGPATVEVTFKETECPSTAFTDLDTKEWYHDGVDFALENGLMKGVDTKIFDPNGSLTRAMFVTIIYRMEGQPKVTGDNPYSDVVSGSWYDRAVKWASDKGIVNGYSTTAFGPEDKITREQMAAVMMRYAQYKNIKTTARANLNSYTDASSVSSWALDAMRWANATGLITGRTKSTLVPQGDTTRAETATILMRFDKDVL